MSSHAAHSGSAIGFFRPFQTVGIRRSSQQSRIPVRVNMATRARLRRAQQARTAVAGDTSSQSDGDWTDESQSSTGGGRHAPGLASTPTHDQGVADGMRASVVTPAADLGADFVGGGFGHRRNFRIGWGRYATSINSTWGYQRWAAAYIPEFGCGRYYTAPCNSNIGGVRFGFNWTRTAGAKGTRKNSPTTTGYTCTPSNTTTTAVRYSCNTPNTTATAVCYTCNTTTTTAVRYSCNTPNTTATAVYTCNTTTTTAVCDSCNTTHTTATAVYTCTATTNPTTTTNSIATTTPATVCFADSTTTTTTTNPTTTTNSTTV